MNNSCECNKQCASNTCGNVGNGHCGNSYLIVLVLYILLAILFTCWLF